MGGGVNRTRWIAAMLADRGQGFSAKEAWALARVGVRCLPDAGAGDVCRAIYSAIESISGETFTDEDVAAVLDGRMHHVR